MNTSVEVPSRRARLGQWIIGLVLLLGGPGAVWYYGVGKAQPIPQGGGRFGGFGGGRVSAMIIAEELGAALAVTPFIDCHILSATLLLAVGEDALAGAIARLTRFDLPSCSVLLGDGDLAAGLAWGEPLGLSEIGAWEFSLTATPLADHPWTPLTPGTIAVLDSCGPTVFRVPFPQELT